MCVPFNPINHFVQIDLFRCLFQQILQTQKLCAVISIEALNKKNKKKTQYSCCIVGKFLGPEGGI